MRERIRLALSALIIGLAATPASAEHYSLSLRDLFDGGKTNQPQVPVTASVNPALTAPLARILAAVGIDQFGTAMYISTVGQALGAFSSSSANGGGLSFSVLLTPAPDYSGYPCRQTVTAISAGNGRGTATVTGTYCFQTPMRVWNNLGEVKSAGSIHGGGDARQTAGGSGSPSGHSKPSHSAHADAKPAKPARHDGGNAQASSQGAGQGGGGGPTGQGQAPGFGALPQAPSPSAGSLGTAGFGAPTVTTAEVPFPLKGFPSRPASEAPAAPAKPAAVDLFGDSGPAKPASPAPAASAPPPAPAPAWPSRVGTGQ